MPPAIRQPQTHLPPWCDRARPPRSGTARESGSGADVSAFGAGGVGAGALEQHQLGAADVAGGAYGVVELAEAGHGGGNDQRLAGTSGLFDQRQVVVFEAGDLVGGGREILQKINSSFIKRLAEADQAELASALHDCGMPFPGAFSLVVEVVEVLANPDGIRINDVEGTAAHVARHRVGGICLQIGRVGARMGSRFYDHKARYRLWLWLPLS